MKTWKIHAWKVGLLISNFQYSTSCDHQLNDLTKFGYKQTKCEGVQIF
jgi:hypothetical protein